jgi:hypothetical protein
MELDKKALAVARLTAAIFEWDPRGRSVYDDANQRKQVITTLINEALPSQKSKENVIKMILAMVLLTSGSVATVRNPEGFSDKKQTRWSHILSEPAQMVLKILGFPSYELITKQDYINAKQLLPVIGSSSMLENEVYSVFSKSGLSASRPSLASFIDRGERKRGIGGYDQLHRGLSAMSDAVVARLTNLSRPWDMTRGVSTSRDYGSAKGFSQKDGANSVLLSFENPKKRGFNALSLSKYGSEEEIVLSGIAKFTSYQLTFYAEALEEEGDVNAKEYAFNISQNMLFLRRGYKAFWGENNVSPERSHKFVKMALSGEPFKLTGQSGLTVTLKAKPRTADITLFGEIQ